MKNIIWIALLAGAALAILSWWGKSNEIKPASDKKTECDKLPENERAKCMGHTAQGIPVPPKQTRLGIIT